MIHLKKWLTISIGLLSATASGQQKSIVVSPDGGADFLSIQQAIDAIPARNSQRVVVHIKPGIYKERLIIPRDKPNITLIGDDDVSRVIVTYNWDSSHVENGKSVGTTGSTSTFIAAPNIVCENITFSNTAGDIGQAVAIKTTGDRQIFRHCRFLGWQDTLYADAGRQYFVDCYVEGRVDFIFGGATAVFDRCEIHSKNGGYVTAARTPQQSPFGYVFLNCKLTGDGVDTFLGRPWRSYAAVAFINCELGSHIDPEGWSSWKSAPLNQESARYSEYQSTGPGAAPDRRVAWSRQLTPAQAEKYTIANVLGGEDHWDPTAADQPAIASTQPTTTTAEQ